MRRRNGYRCATSSFYSDNSIDLRLNTTVTAVDARAREVTLTTGDQLSYDRLLLATGAEPVAPSLPGAKPSDVLVLRTLKDCRTIIERAKTARRAVVLGASFIGLEVAASLRARNIEVHVVAPEEHPMEEFLGRTLAASYGRFTSSTASSRTWGDGARPRGQANDALRRKPP